GASPVLLALGGPLLRREQPRAAVVAAAVLVAAGAAVVQGAGGGSAAGVAFAAGALVCEALFSLMAAPILAGMGAVRLSAWACWLAPAAFGALALAGAGVRAPTGSELAGLLYLAGPVTVGAFVLWYAAIARVAVERAGLLVGLMPV